MGDCIHVHRQKEKDGTKKVNEMPLIPSEGDGDESGCGCVSAHAGCSDHCIRKICCSGASLYPCGEHDASPFPLRRSNGFPFRILNPQLCPSSPVFRSDSGSPGNACHTEEIIITSFVICTNVLPFFLLLLWCTQEQYNHVYHKRMIIYTKYCTNNA